MAQSVETNNSKLLHAEVSKINKVRRLLLAMALFLASCNEATSIPLTELPPTSTPYPTSTATATGTATATATFLPTFTPVPSETSTPMPISTPLGGASIGVAFGLHDKESPDHFLGYYVRDNLAQPSSDTQLFSQSDLAKKFKKAFKYSVLESLSPNGKMALIFLTAPANIEVFASSDLTIFDPIPESQNPEVNLRFPFATTFWSPDNKHIMGYCGKSNLCVIEDKDGKAYVTTLAQAGPLGWSPDGQTLYYQSSGAVWSYRPATRVKTKTNFDKAGLGNQEHIVAFCIIPGTYEPLFLTQIGYSNDGVDSSYRLYKALPDFSNPVVLTSFSKQSNFRWNLQVSPDDLHVLLHSVYKADLVINLTDGKIEVDKGKNLLLCGWSPDGSLVGAFDGWIDGGGRLTFIHFGQEISTVNYNIKFRVGQSCPVWLW